MTQESQELPTIKREFKTAAQDLMIISTRVYAALTGGDGTLQKSSGREESAKMSEPEKKKAFAELGRQATEFGEFLQQHEKIVVAHHIDADGLMSALLLIHLIAAQREISVSEAKKYVTFFSINNGDRNFEPEQLQQLEELPDPERTGIVFVDISPRNNEILQRITNMGFSLANIDHHEIKSDDKYFAARYNPHAVSNMPPQVTSELSTSALFSLIDSMPLELAWLMEIGNKGDDANLFNVILKSARLAVGEKIPSQVKQARDDFTIQVIAQFLNMVGATERYGETALERDEFVRTLIEKIIAVNVYAVDGLDQLHDVLTEDEEYKTLRNQIGNTEYETLQFLLQAEQIAGEASYEPSLDGSWTPRVFEIESEDGKSTLVLEGASFRLMIHSIDSPLIIIGDMIKAHLRSLFLDYEMRGLSDVRPCPTTVILVQRCAENNYSLGLYTSDAPVERSATYSCSAQMHELGKANLAKGGGHGRRAGGTATDQTVVPAVTTLFTNYAKFLSETWRERLPKEFTNNVVPMIEKLFNAPA